MTDFLFSIPTLLSGVARVVDLGGQFDAYNSSPTPAAADRHAADSDWNAVAKDLLGAARLVAAEESVQEEQEAQTPA